MPDCDSPAAPPHSLSPHPPVPPGPDAGRGAQAAHGAQLQRGAARARGLSKGGLPVLLALLGSAWAGRWAARVLGNCFRCPPISLAHWDCISSAARMPRHVHEQASRHFEPQAAHMPEAAAASPIAPQPFASAAASPTAPQPFAHAPPAVPQQPCKRLSGTACRSAGTVDSSACPPTAGTAGLLHPGQR